jgi:hypothetical protein
MQLTATSASAFFRRHQEFFPTDALCRFLALIALQNIINFEPGSHRFRAEHYVSSSIGIAVNAIFLTSS